jgi:hypothetical protein
MPLAQISRGILGDLSVTSMVLLGYFMISPTTPRDKSNQMLILALIVGMLFYPAALGLGMTDPYQWGYLNAYRGAVTPALFLVALGAITLLALRLNNDLILFCIAAATSAFLLGAMESRNIWDYLIDPMLVIFAMIRTGIITIKQLVGRHRAQPDIHH